MSEQLPAARAQAWVDFSTRVAMLIAVMSAVSAFAGWRASLADIEAADLNRRVVQERLQVEAARLQAETKVYRDKALFARYQEHILAEQLLEGDAQNALRRARGMLEHDPQSSAGRDELNVAAALDMQAQGELALARSLTPFFRVRSPDETATPGVMVYDETAALRNIRITNVTLRTVHPEETEGALRTMHRRTWSLYGVAAVFVFSVFLLTLAEFGPVPARTIIAYAGMAVIACGVVGWGLAEILLR